MGAFEVRCLVALASSLRWVALADGATRLDGPLGGPVNDRSSKLLFIRQFQIGTGL